MNYTQIFTREVIKRPLKYYKTIISTWNNNETAERRVVPHTQKLHNLRINEMTILIKVH